MKTLNGHDHNVSSVKFVNSGDFIISASRDKTLKMWEIATGYCIRTYTGHTEWVRNISMHYEGSYFASASNDETIAVWALDTNTPMAIL